MDFAAIKAKLATSAEVTVESPTFGKVKMRRMPAAKAVAVSRKLSTFNADDPVQFCAFQAELIAASVVGEDGSLPLETPEGREVLAMLPAGELLELFKEANAINGLAVAVKDSEKN